MDNRRTTLIAAIKLSEEYKAKIRNVIVALEENESDSEDEFFLKLASMEADSRLRPLRRSASRLQGYVEDIIPRFSAREFRSHFRMDPMTVNELENKISPLLIRQGEEGRLTIRPRNQILSVLWLLATPDSYRSIGQKFGMSKSSLHHCFRRMYKALNDIAPQNIYWPTPTEMQSIKVKFFELAGLPDVIGAIDGCHIEVDAPDEQAAAYRTGKKKYALQLQGVCTPDLIFTDVFAGYPGSVHDARILRNSPLYRDAPQLFYGRNEYIIGDKAYPVLVWCIPPYKDLGNLTPAEINFNQKLSKTRQVIERSFGLLKGRFRRLKHLAMSRTDEIAPTILATCVLHNLCLRGLHERREDIESYILEGQITDAENVEDTQENIFHSEHSSAETATAISKINYLKNLVFINKNKINIIFHAASSHNFSNSLSIISL